MSFANKSLATNFEGEEKTYISKNISIGSNLVKPRVKQTFNQIFKINSLMVNLNKSIQFIHFLAKFCKKHIDCQIYSCLITIFNKSIF